MRILVVSPELPAPPLGGLGLQLSHLLEGLANRHDVTVLGVRPASEADVVAAGASVFEVEQRGAGSRARTWLRASARGVPFAAVATGEPVARAAADLVAARSFDVVHVASSILAEVASVLGKTPAIMSALDAWHLNAAVNRRLAPPWATPLYALEERRIRRFEARALRPYGRVVVVSDQDAKALRALDPTLEIEVVPNGVDTEAFAPSDEVAAEAGHVVFSGTMDWSPNVESARFLATEVLPRVRAARPDVHLAIVGRSPAPEVVALGDEASVHVTGEVATMQPWLRRAQVYACPMVSGTGIKNKLLEALACATPAVATPLACQGMEVRDERELLVADGADRFATAIVRLLDDAELRERLGAGGRSYVCARHSWSSVVAEYERIYLDVAKA